MSVGFENLRSWKLSLNTFVFGRLWNRSYLIVPSVGLLGFLIHAGLLGAPDGSSFTFSKSRSRSFSECEASLLKILSDSSLSSSLSPTKLWEVSFFWLDDSPAMSVSSIAKVLDVSFAHGFGKEASSEFKDSLDKVSSWFGNSELGSKSLGSVVTTEADSSTMTFPETCIL